MFYISELKSLNILELNYYIEQFNTYISLPKQL